MNTRLQAISRQLARIGASGSFATRRTAPAGDLHLEVKGVGRIRFPITAETALSHFMFTDKLEWKAYKEKKAAVSAEGRRV